MAAQKYPVKVISEKKMYQDMGFTEYQARKLCEVRDINPVKIGKLLEQGCAVNTAYRIFRPDAHGST